MSEVMGPLTCFPGATVRIRPTINVPVSATLTKSIELNVTVPAMVVDTTHANHRVAPYGMATVRILPVPAGEPNHGNPVPWDEIQVVFMRDIHAVFCDCDSCASVTAGECRNMAERATPLRWYAKCRVAECQTRILFQDLKNEYGRMCGNHAWEDVPFETASQLVTELAKGHAEDRASAFDINEVNVSYVLEGIADCDPEVMDTFPTDPLSGEYADSFTPVILRVAIEQEIGVGILADSDFTELETEFCDTFEAHVAHEIERRCRTLLS